MFKAIDPRVMASRIAAAWTPACLARATSGGFSANAVSSNLPTLIRSTGKAESIEIVPMALSIRFKAACEISQLDSTIIFTFGIKATSITA